MSLDIYAVGFRLVRESNNLFGSKCDEKYIYRYTSSRCRKEVRIIFQWQ